VFWRAAAGGEGEGRKEVQPRKLLQRERPGKGAASRETGSGV